MTHTPIADTRQLNNDGPYSELRNNVAMLRVFVYGSDIPMDTVRITHRNHGAFIVMLCTMLRCFFLLRVLIHTPGCCSLFVVLSFLCFCFLNTMPTTINAVSQLPEQ